MAGSLKLAITRVLEHEDQDEQLLLEHVKDLLTAFERSNPQLDRTTPIAELFEEYLTLNNDDAEKDRIVSGLHQLDERFVFNLGEFVVLGGRPSMGKSQLMIDLAMNISIKDPVLYISFDQSRTAIIRRMIANLTEIDVSLMQHGLLNDLELTMVRSVEKEFRSRQLFINDSSYSSVRAVRELCRKHIDRDGVKVIFIDYLQMLGSERYRHNRELEVAYVCRTLKELARNSNVLVVVASQLSRSVEMRGGDKRPVLSDLRESGAIEQDADKVLFIYRPEYYGFTQDENGNNTHTVIELILAKNRGGQLGRFEFKRNENFTRVLSLAEHLQEFRISHDRLKDLEDGDPPF